MNADLRDLFLSNLLAIVRGIVASASLLLFLGKDSIAAYTLLMTSIIRDGYTFADIFVKATPLILTALAFALLLVTLAAMVVGGLWGAFIGFVKARFKSNEFLISMMSTCVALAVMNYFLRTALMEAKHEYPQTDPFATRLWMPTILEGTRLHAGFILGVLIGTLVFGLAEAVAIYKQSSGTMLFPNELFIALPYILTIVLTISRKSFNVPAKLGLPYRKEN